MVTFGYVYYLYFLLVCSFPCYFFMLCFDEQTLLILIYTFLIWTQDKFHLPFQLILFMCSHFFLLFQYLLVLLDMFHVDCWKSLKLSLLIILKFSSLLGYSFFHKRFCGHFVGHIYQYFLLWLIFLCFRVLPYSNHKGIFIYFKIFQFCVLHLFLIHWEIIIFVFVYCIRWGCNFIFFLPIIQIASLK